MAAAAAGDVGLLCALVALRRVENGRAGREFGVLSEPAPTYAAQLHIAANSLRQAERRAARVHPQVPLRAADGFFTPNFLQLFSAHWCPLNAANDPTHLNEHHAKNLITLAGDYAGMLRDAISRLG